jgi:hypothetical protein
MVMVMVMAMAMAIINVVDTRNAPGPITRTRGTEAADVQDIVALRSLRRTVRLDFDADQLRRADAHPLLVHYERLPLGQHARHTLTAVSKRSVTVNPTLVVAHPQCLRSHLAADVFRKKM